MFPKTNRNIEQKFTIVSDLSGHLIKRKEAVFKVWKEAYHKLGNEDPENNYDEAFRVEIEQKVRQMGETSRVLKDTPELSQPFKYTPTGKAAVVDGLVNEVIILQGSMDIVQQLLNQRMHPRRMVRGNNVSH